MREPATLLCIVFIAALFWLDRDSETRTSNGLWISIVYFAIECSRPVSVWLGMAPQASETSIYLEGSPIDRAAGLVLLAAGLIVIAARGRQVGRLLRKHGPIVAYFSYAAVSVLWSEYPYVTFKHWTKGICDVLMVLIVVTEANPEAAIKRVLARVGFVLIPLSLLYSKFYPELGRFISPGWVTEYAGVTQNKNELGQICLIFGLGALWSLCAYWRDRDHEDRRRHLMAQGGLLVVILWLFVMANSMTSLSSFVLAGGLMVWLSRKNVRPGSSSVHLAIALTLGVAAFALFGDRSMVSMVGRNPTLTGRTDLWHWVVTLVRNPWLGAGYESFFMGPRLKEFWVLDNGSFSGLQEAHSGYLEVYLNLGWVGVVIFASLVVTGYRKVISIFRSNPAFGRLTLAWFVAALIYGFTEAGFRMQTPILIIFFLAIMAAPEAARPADLPGSEFVQEASLAELAPAAGAGHRSWFIQ